MIQKLIENISVIVGGSKSLLLIQIDGLYSFFLISKDSDLSEIEKKSFIGAKFFGTFEDFQIMGLEKEKKNFEKITFFDVETKLYVYPKHARVQMLKKAITNVQAKKKVLIIDDSKTIQNLLNKIIQESLILDVVGVASCPSEAKSFLESNDVDLITLDIHMPEMTGVDFLKTYLRFKNIPTVVISSLSYEESSLVLEALNCGALSYIQKPSIESIKSVSVSIINELESIKVSSGVNSLRGKSLVEFEEFLNPILIGSSTGGPQALERLLTELPSQIPPIIIAQHIPEFFSKALADRLNEFCSFEVKLYEEGEIIRENCVYFTPGGSHLRLIKEGDELKGEVLKNKDQYDFCPSVDCLFESAADNKIESLALILTGMGRDGARGIKKLKDQTNSFILAEDESSCVVFGMPKVAIATGCVDDVIPLDEIVDKVIIFHNRLNLSKQISDKKFIKKTI